MRHLSRFLAVVAVAVLASTPQLAGQKKVAGYSALAVTLGAPPGLSTETVIMEISRWSTDAERTDLTTALLEGGPEKLLDVLKKMPSVGFIRTPSTVGYDLRYAYRTTTGGAEHVMLATDRPIGIWEVGSGSRTLDYPFTVIELRVPRSGEGEGKVSVATKVVADRGSKTIALENYSISPVMLRGVKRE